MKVKFFGCVLVSLNVMVILIGISLSVGVRGEMMGNLNLSQVELNHEDNFLIPTTTESTLSQDEEATTTQSSLIEEIQQINSNVIQLTNSSDAEENAIQYYLNQHQPFEGVDTWEAPLEMRKNFPYYLSGYDSENRPIWVIEGGRWNLRTVVEQGQEAMDIFEKYARQGFYRARKAIKEKSTPDLPVEDDIVIVDFDQLNLLQVAHVPSVAFLLHLATKIRQDVLDTLYRGIVVNTNSVALSLINIAKPILGPIVERAQIYGTNQAKWKPHVLKLCPKSQLPEWYGGYKDFQPVQVFG